MNQVTRSTALACNISLFRPVRVSRGRQFKGDGFMVGTYENSFGTAKAIIFTVDGQRSTTTYSYCEPREATRQEIEDAKALYVIRTIEDALSWCKSTLEKKGEPYTRDRLESFARNTLMKNHRDLEPAINEAIADTRNAVDVVKSTLEWAMNLKTQAGYNHGRYCQGGNPYPPAKVVDIALRALQHKGADKLDGFKEAWDMYTTLFNLPNTLNKEPEF